MRDKRFWACTHSTCSARPTIQRFGRHPGARRRRCSTRAFHRTTAKTHAGVRRGVHDQLEMAEELSHWNTVSLLITGMVAEAEAAIERYYRAIRYNDFRALRLDDGRHFRGHYAGEHVARWVLRAEAVAAHTTTGVSYLGRHFVNDNRTFTSNAVLVAWSRQFAVDHTHAARRASGDRRAAASRPRWWRRSGGASWGQVGFALDYWRGESIILGVLGPVEVGSATAGVTYFVVRKWAPACGGLTSNVTLTQGEARVYHTEVVGSWRRGATPALIVAVSCGADFQHGRRQDQPPGRQASGPQRVPRAHAAGGTFSRCSNQILQPLGGIPRRAKR